MPRLPLFDSDVRLQQQNAGVRAGLEGVVVPEADLHSPMWAVPIISIQRRL